MQRLRTDRPIFKIHRRPYGEAEFPVKISPLPDELLSSWLIRLAVLHRTMPSTFTNLYLPETKNKLWAGDVDLHADDDLLMRLAEKAELPVELLRAMTLRSYEGVLFERLHTATGGTPFLLKMAMRGRWSRSPGIRWCPECLAEDNPPYFRKKWRLALFTACLKHRKSQVERCACGRTLTMYKAIWLDGKPCCPVCRFALHDLSGENSEMPARAVGAQEQIRQIMEHGYVVKGGAAVYSHHYFKALHHMLRMLMSRKWGDRLRSEVGLEWVVDNCRKAFERVAIRDQARLLEKAVWLLDEWPWRFVAVCRRQKVWGSALLHDLDDAPFWYWRVVEELLCRGE